MLPFSNWGPIDRSERKALLFAVLFSCLFIGVFSFARPHTQRTRSIPAHLTIPTQTAPPIKFNEPELAHVDSLEKFRVRPAQFEQIDFKNHSYGIYTSSDGTKIDLSLQHSDLQLPNLSGWFSLQDVYYTDLTGDGRAEAIVWLSHVTCGPSCDGGANLFYIYTERNGKLKPIWQYETGTYRYGCGLKSFIVSEKQIVVELLGDCTLATIDDPGASKFIANGFTSIRLEFDDRRFAQKSIDFFITPPRDVKSYAPDIHIYYPLGPQSGSSLLPN